MPGVIKALLARTHLNTGSVLWLCGYLAMLLAVVCGMFYGRARGVAVYGSSVAQTEWETWRSDAQEMAGGDGPVKRRQPQSTEPPALVLMRDHFGACLGLALILSSVLFGTFMFFVRGALAAAPAAPHPLPDSRLPLP